jgi:hypothetical protein
MNARRARARALYESGGSGSSRHTLGAQLIKPVIK